jgi:Mlc titration factor MtfA (ptsG expression regulator)
MFGLFKERRRAKLRAAPFPPAWSGVLESLPAYRALPPQDQRELRGHVQVFLDEKVFEGCGGLDITDEIRVTIAAQACMLLLHRDTDYYPGLTSILVYPSGYVANSKRVGPDGVVTEGPQARLGESWTALNSRFSGGPVVLSWRDVVAGAADIHDGHNVVFHEFAHQLDAEWGGMDGAPALDRRSKYVAWARVLGSEYKQLLDDLRRGHEPWLDAYGATNPAEFFAVLTEAFFEQPLKLRTKHPELYAQLADFYRQDPAAAGTA